MAKPDKLLNSNKKQYVFILYIITTAPYFIVLMRSYRAYGNFLGRKKTAVAKFVIDHRLRKFGKIRSGMRCEVALNHI